MITKIIILAAGAQTRLPSLEGLPKHLLTLRQCNEQVLLRTLRLIQEQLVDNYDLSVVIYGSDRIRQSLLPFGYEGAPTRGRFPGALGMVGNLLVRIMTAVDEKLVACTLERLDQVFERETMTYDRTIVLLGDVVWSRHALTQVLTDTRPLVFAGTADLTPGTGEIFAFAWAGNRDPEMRSALAATPRSPQRGTYQCGQLRNLLWQIRGTKDNPATDTERYLVIKDWTKDIDTEEDLQNLPRLDTLAHLEELEYQRSRLA